MLKTNEDMQHKIYNRTTCPLVLHIIATPTIYSNDKQLNRKNIILNLKFLLKYLIIYTPENHKCKNTKKGENTFKQ